jgi:phospholipid/cholesterol/gamma-HCH transport system permease protein
MAERDTEDADAVARPAACARAPRPGWASAKIWRLGFAARFFRLLLLHSGTAFRRFGLTVREIYFAGVLSMVIILCPACSSAWCWRCRATRRCSVTVPPEALGILVALSLVRELGRWSPACCSPAAPGSAITAEIGLMKATEQIAAMEMMAVDPIARVVAPRFWAG